MKKFYTSNLNAEKDYYHETIFWGDEIVARIHSYQHVDLTAERRYVFTVNKTQEYVKGFQFVSDAKEELFKILDQHYANA
tara:strand:+ start:1207 stop:1446 length:240 start_codon:yes stop_codon:yes gene_type:complete